VLGVGGRPAVGRNSGERKYPVRVPSPYFQSWGQRRSVLIRGSATSSHPNASSEGAGSPKRGGVGGGAKKRSCVSVCQCMCVSVCVCCDTGHQISSVPNLCEARRTIKVCRPWSQAFFKTRQVDALIAQRRGALSSG
jgi:hypothetical protein